MKSAEIFSKLRDFDEFNERIAAAVTSLTKRGHDPLAAALLLREYADNVADGRDRVPFVALAALNTDENANFFGDGSQEHRDKLATDLEESGVIARSKTKTIRQILRERLSQWRAAMPVLDQPSRGGFDGVAMSEDSSLAERFEKATSWVLYALSLVDTSRERRGSRPFATTKNG